MSLARWKEIDYRKPRKEFEPRKKKEVKTYDRTEEYCPKKSWARVNGEKERD